MPDHKLNSDELLLKLKQNGIDLELYEHEAVFTVEESLKKPKISQGVGTKNLFLRDEKGKRHFLVVQRDVFQADLKFLAERLQCKRLSFASPERLNKYLGVIPGSVGLLGLIHDIDCAVQLYFDDSLGDFDALQTHPLVNHRTVVMTRDDVKNFLELTGHRPSWTSLKPFQF